MLIILLIAAGIPSTGCTVANRPLNEVSLPLEQRLVNQTRAAFAAAPLPAAEQSPEGSQSVHPSEDGLFIGLAISGGGSRSANFSAASMFHLQQLGLLQRVDYISTVSGGSLTGAYYCLNGDDRWNPELLQRKLTHSFASDVIFSTLLPWNFLTLALTDWDRGDLLAGSFRKHLFSANGRAQTFADLRPDRPRLLINATNLQTGRSFVFNDRTFDELNSDLEQYPVAYAVAASSAVPVLIHHITVRDYSTIFKRYVHLIDGGVVDNLGIQTLLEVYRHHKETAHAADAPNPYPRGAIFIVLDARTNIDAELASKGDIGLIDSFVAGAGLSTTALLNRASTATLAEMIVRYSPPDVTAGELRRQIRQLNDEGYIELTDVEGQPVRVLHLALTRTAAAGEHPSEGFSQTVNRIDTYFNISHTDAALLYEAAELLIQDVFAEQIERLRTAAGAGEEDKETK